MLSKLKPGKGKVLISEPFMLDPSFKRSVVLLVEHNDEGTVGFVLNQEMEMMLNELMDPEFPYFEAPVFVGGPVQQDTLHFLHKLGDKIPGSIEVAKGIYWGGNYEAFTILLQNGEIGKEDIRFFVGYSGWSPGQLHSELKENAWIVASADRIDIFSGNEDMWKSVVKSLGNKYAHIANFPENPYLN